MIFSEEKAIEIIGQFNLDPVTIRVWKTRGKIPDRYAEGKAWGKKEKIKGLHTLQQAKNLNAVLNNTKFVLAYLFELAAIENVAAVMDFKRGRSQLNEVDFVPLKTAINTIRNEVKVILAEMQITPIRSTTEKKIKNLLKRKELSISALLEKNKYPQAHQRLYAWSIGERQIFPTEDINLLKTSLLVFLTETTI